MTRGIRNNNPGNLRRGGARFKGEKARPTDPQFRQFEAMRWGWRALLTTLRTYGVCYGLDRIENIIPRWAPPSENDTRGYIDAVCRLTGFGASQPLDWRDRRRMTALAEAIGRVECGPQLNTDELAAGWELFAADYLPTE